MITPQQQSIDTQNGYTIVAKFFVPDGEVKAAVLIAPAMGVSQNYYAAFAQWLASQGYLVATFDYAGMGLSLNGDIRKLKVNILDWARFDCDAMLNALGDQAPGKPMFWLGHSLGGQILGFVPQPERIAKAVTIASGSGYWLDNVASLRWKVWWLWYFLTPLLPRLLGYFPGKRLRKVGDLPLGVINQWRRWCLHPDYAVGVEGQAAREGFAAIRSPITSLSFADDELMSARNIESLHGFYARAPRIMKRIAPQDIGVQRIGHFGFFNERFVGSLWQSHLLPELC